MLNIVIFGPPGAGKGTQSMKLIDRYNLVHLSTGDILRAEIIAGSILGQEAKILMDQGMLVPDDFVITMIKNKIEKNVGAKGFIFDGFPRTIAQAKALDKLLELKGMKITLTLALEVSTDELTKRILQRGMESGRTDDIDLDTIRNRVNEYNNKTAPLKDYYLKQKKFNAVSGVGSVDDIFNSLCVSTDRYFIHDYASTPGIMPQEYVGTISRDSSAFDDTVSKTYVDETVADSPKRNTPSLEVVGNETATPLEKTPKLEESEPTLLIKKVSKSKPTEKKTAKAKPIKKKIVKPKPLKKKTAKKAKPIKKKVAIKDKKVKKVSKKVVAKKNSKTPVKKKIAKKKNPPKKNKATKKKSRR